ncbi:MAG: hypothetical protein ACYTG0_06145 [Planctomycetota bacterium]
MGRRQKRSAGRKQPAEALDHPSGPVERERAVVTPFRPSVPWLVVTGVLLAAWIAFLAVLALMS